MSEDCKTERAKKLVTIRQPLDLATVRKKLDAAKGKQYWRSLEELAGAEEFQEMLHREFPQQASTWTDGVSRRNFLQLMGASLALAGLSGCTKQPAEYIVPYVRQPEEIIPGKPLYFASAMPLGSTVTPVLVKSDMGRPIKVDGNPDHPAGNMGSTVFTQASILGLYDPDRSQTIAELGEVRSWSDFSAGMLAPLAEQRQKQGAGLRFLSESITSPTLASQMSAALKMFPGAKWHVWEPVNRDNFRAGAQMAFGQPVEMQPRMENANVIVSFDFDFLSPANNPSFLRDAREFARRRKIQEGATLNRLYVVESALTNAGSKSDNRLPARAVEIEGITRAIAAQIGVGNAPISDGITGGLEPALKPEQEKFVTALVKDLQQNRGASLIMAGETQPPIVHALVHAMNQALGNVGKTVIYTDPVTALPSGFHSNVQSLQELANDIEAKKVDLLVILDCNVAYTSPKDMGFTHRQEDEHPEWNHESILLKVPLRVHLGLYQDETAQLCQWHVNAAHYLESWSDARTEDGTPGIIQPLIDPLYSGKTAHDVLGIFSDQPVNSSYEWVRSYWQSQHNTPDFEAWWRKALHDGFIANDALPPKQVTAKVNLPPPTKPGAGLELVLRPDSGLYDGRFANIGWLQELPKPITLFTWDNAALFSLATAEKYGIKASQEMVELDVNGRKLQTVVWIQPGQPDDTVTLQLGYGRNSAGRTGNAHGYNGYLLSASNAPLVATGMKVRKLDLPQHEVAAVHIHHNVSFESNNGEEVWRARGVVRSATLAEYQANPEFAHEQFELPPKSMTMYHPEEHPYDPKNTPYAWGMSIDLNSCIGCSTCVVACQSENNIPVVGKWEVRRGREMHWIRIDNYFGGDFENPRMHFQPVPCMQCENAPCELVCPVGATTHSSEGLNDMTYNRCVGTRYCSNNCPYKVRRFNFLLYADYETPQYKLMNNPDVSVRSRGVMEKCTYCVQRITRGRIEAEKANRLIEDGEVKTACQQACPADAIVFGNINDPNSRVAQLKRKPTNYSMLGDLNTRPRTTYLAQVTNPNPELMMVEEMKFQRHILGRGHGPDAEKQEPEQQ